MKNGEAIEEALVVRWCTRWKCDDKRRRNGARHGTGAVDGREARSGLQQKQQQQSGLRKILIVLEEEERKALHSQVVNIGKEERGVSKRWNAWWKGKRQTSVECEYGG